jgi:hypothetical protein
MRRSQGASRARIEKFTSLGNVFASYNDAVINLSLI